MVKIDSQYTPWHHRPASRIALNFDLRGLLFPEAKLKSGGVTVARYNPMSFVGLLGVRFFLN